MKIKVTFTLDVDPDKWCYEYGIARADVRKDVQGYFEYIAQEQLMNVNCHNSEDESEGELYVHTKPTN